MMISALASAKDARPSWCSLLYLVIALLATCKYVGGQWFVGGAPCVHGMMMKKKIKEKHGEIFKRVCVGTKITVLSTALPSFSAVLN
jgi:hypothetical protein